MVIYVINFLLKGTTTTTTTAAAAATVIKKTQSRRGNILFYSISYERRIFLLYITSSYFKERNICGQKLKKGDF